MTLITQILILSVVLLFLFIMYLETFAINSARTSKVFGISTEELSKKHFKVLMKNQGVYNGLLALALLYSVCFAANGKELAGVLLVYCIAVAAYGGATSHVMIFVKQGTFPLLALLSLLFLG